MKADRSLSNSARCAAVKNSWLAYLGERCRGVSDSSVQMPCRSGSPQGVFSAGASADVRLMDSEMTAPKAAAENATVITEPENLSRMMVSFCQWATCQYATAPLPT